MIPRDHAVCAHHGLCGTAPFPASAALGREAPEGELLFSPTRRQISAAMDLSEKVPSARPAAATCPGMPQTIELAWSCTRTCPPFSWISCAPLLPSLPMPVSTTASALDPKEFATE